MNEDDEFARLRNGCNARFTYIALKFIANPVRMEASSLYMRGYIGEDAMWHTIEHQDWILRSRNGRSRTFLRSTTIVTSTSGPHGRSLEELPVERCLRPPHVVLCNSTRRELTAEHHELCSASATRWAARISVSQPHPLSDHTTPSFRAALGTSCLARFARAGRDSRVTRGNSFAGAGAGDGAA